MQATFTPNRGVRGAEAVEPNHLKDLLAARRHLVEQRRSLIKSIGFGYQREQTEAHINLVTRIQTAIEVVDKAIGDEQREPQ